MAKISSSESKEHLNSGNKYPTWRKLSEAGKAVILATLLVSSSCSCEKDDIVPPTIEINQANTKDVEIGSKIEVRGGSDVYLGGKPVAICTDNEGSPRTTFTYDGKNISVVEKDGILVVLSTDNAGNKSEKRQQITVKKAPIIENEAPKITCEIPNGSTISIPGGAKFTQKDLAIYFRAKRQDTKLLEMTDKETPFKNLTVSCTLNGQPLEFGKWVEGGELVISVEDDGSIDGQTDKGEKKSETVTYKLDATINDSDVVEGLEDWNPTLKVDTQVNLLQGLSFKDGWNLDKIFVEQNGSKIEISNPWTPTEAGDIAFIFAVKNAESGATYETTKIEREVKNAMEYNEVHINQANIFETTGWNSYKTKLDYSTSNCNTRYEFYENMGHVHTDAILQTLDQIGGAERQEQLSHLHVIVAGDCPSEGFSDDDGIWIVDTPEYTHKGYETHGNHMVKIIKNNGRIPGVAQRFPGKIECIYKRKDENGNNREGSYRGHILDIVKNNPNEKFIVSCSTSTLGGDKRENIKDSKLVQILRELFKQKNCILYVALGNNDVSYKYVLGEHEPAMDLGCYIENSIDGQNLINALGCNYNGEFINYDNTNSGFQTTIMPKGIKTPLVNIAPYASDTKNGKCFANKYRTTSSVAAAELASIGIDKLMENPDMSMEYLYNLLIGTAKPVKAAYHNGEKFDSNMKIFDEKEVSKEIHLPDFPDQFSATSIYEFTTKTKMPLFIPGKGMECYIDGKRVPCAADNINNADKILSASKTQKFRFNPELFKKQGGKDVVEISAYLIDFNGNFIPDITKTATIPVR